MSDITKKEKAVKTDKRILVTISTGKFVWYPALAIVDFIENGKRSHSSAFETIFVTQNSEYGALKAIMRYLGKQVKELKK